MADGKRTRFGDRGAAAVELAMTAVFLVLLVAGIFDLGRALYISVGLNEAAQEGAIYGSFAPGDPGAIEDRVIASITFPELADENVAINCPPPPPKRVEVIVTYDVDLVAPIISQWFGGTITLTRTSIGEVFIGNCVPET